jgi:putative glycosyltransferase (TIGR04348 family)
VKKPSIAIVSPAAPGANNGNARTAQRWCEMLRPDFDARVTTSWPDGGAPADLLIALHARRSAPAIQAWAADSPRRPLLVVLTGTDLYQDIAVDAAARQSLERADALVVLQDMGIEALPASLRGKATVVYQSTAPLLPAAKGTERMDAVVVGHLRAVKAPGVVFDAVRRLAAADRIHVTHIGDAAEPELGEQARAVERDCAHYRWLGALPHAEARERIRQSHLLVHPSALEGGAHVIMEAVCSGTPVIASRVPGNVGMLGEDYAGYFPPGDSQALAALLREARRTQAEPGGLLARLAAQGAARAALFEPAAERARLLALVRRLLAAA